MLTQEDANDTVHVGLGRRYIVNMTYGGISYVREEIYIYDIYYGKINSDDEESNFYLTFTFYKGNKKFCKRLYLKDIEILGAYDGT